MGGRNRKVIGFILLGLVLTAGLFFTGYKLGQRQAGLVPQPAPSEEWTIGEKVFCRDPRPEFCTMECIVNPPYICGSDGKSYCTICQACSNLKVKWYIIQDRPCGTE